MFGESLPPAANHPPDYGEFAVFRCFLGHEWAARLPKFSDDTWPRCPRCRRKGYLREPLFYR